MALRLYNTLTRHVEEFQPRNNDAVHMFVCGPTVYDYIHIGNARTFVVFDVIAKWLRHTGVNLRYIQNITDIDDKIIQKAHESGKGWKEIAEAYTVHFRDDMKAMSVTAVDEYPKATDHIAQIIQQVKILRDKGYVYLIEGDGWYFDLSKFPDYGKLSGRTSAQADDGVSRIDDSDKKRNTGDFCVWKLSPSASEPVWEDTELGAGRPGWHIEDTAITEKYFGAQYDLHGGGLDLKFPHHEAEIAQQETASGKTPFVKYWMHAGLLVNAGQKMSKSRGNFTTLHDALERHSPEALRFFFLSSHYRSPLDLSDTALTAAQAAIDRISELAQKHSDTVAASEDALKKIEDAMNNDFNVPEAFAAIFELVRAANIAGAVPKKEFFDFISDTFGIVSSEAPAIPENIRTLVAKRESARQQKDFATSDRIREEIASLGYTVDDTVYGPLVKKQRN